MKLTDLERKEIAFFAAYYKVDLDVVFTLPTLFGRVAEEVGDSISGVVARATERPEAAQYLIGLAHRAAAAFRAETTKH